MTREILIKIRNIILSLVLAFMLVEVYFQVVEIDLPYYELNAKIGKKLLPNQRINHFSEGFYIGKSNEHAYLGEARTPQKTAGIKRILLLGDSYTEGCHLLEQYHFSYLLEQQLNSKSKKYEVLNFGVDNYDYNDMMISYLNYAEKFDPDIIIFSLDKKALIFKQTFTPSPVLAVTGEQLTIDYSFTNSNIFKLYDGLSFVFENSALAKSTINALKTAKSDNIKPILFEKLYQAPKEIENPLDESALLKDERLLKSLDYLKTKTCYFVFRDSISNELVEVFQQKGIKAVSVRPALDNYNLQHNDAYDYWEVTNTLHGHWNHAGQTVVTSFLMDLLNE